MVITNDALGEGMLGVIRLCDTGASIPIQIVPIHRGRYIRDVNLTIGANLGLIKYRKRFGYRIRRVRQLTSAIETAVIFTFYNRP